MRITALILIMLVSVVFQIGCTKKPAANIDADVDANVAVEPVKESPFAAITDPAAALAEGNRLLDDNQTELAVDAYKRAIVLDANLAEAYFKLGIAYALIETEMQASGLDTSTNTNSDGKKGVPAKSNSQKAFEKAVTAYKKLLSSNAKDDIAQFNLGRAYNKLNLDDEAEDAFRAAVKLKPGDTEYQTELGGILVKLAKYHDAIPPLKKAMEIDPDNSRAEKLLEDAEAGAKRIDFAGTNTESKRSSSNSNSNTSSNSNSSSNSASGTNSSRKPANADSRPRTVENKDKKGASKPNDRRP